MPHGTDARKPPFVIFFTKSEAAAAPGMPDYRRPRAQGDTRIPPGGPFSE